MSILKVGLIGCGFMGTMHANCYGAVDGVKVTAVADIRREKAESAAALSGAIVFGEGTELIENADVDVVDICLPTYLHTKYTLAAMEKANYVFIEKPVALTAAECDLLLDKSEKTGCRVQVGQVIRFWDEYVKLKEYVDSKAFGEVVNASFKRISPRPTWGWENWLLDVSRSGGANHDLYIHDADFVLSLFGEPDSSCLVKNSRGEQNSYISAQLKYNGFVVNIESTWDLPVSYPFGAGFRVAFERAAVEYANGKLSLYTEDGVTEIKTEKAVTKSSDFGGNISNLGGYYNELLYFTDKAKRGEPIEKATLGDAVSSLKFILRGNGC